MINQLKQMAIFAKVCEAGSFRLAASQLGVSPSVISAQLSDLEKKLGVALLYRSTRKLSLTNEGRALYQDCRAMLDCAESGLSRLNQTVEHLSGELSITLPAVLNTSPLMKKIADFVKSHPQIKIHLHISDKRIHLIEQGIDVALRIGQLSDNCASLKQRKLFAVERTLVCAPSLLKNYPMPHRPEDLSHFPWIGLRQLKYERSFYHRTEQVTHVKFTPQITVDDVSSTIELASRGVGLTTPAHYMIKHLIGQKKLIVLLPKWQLKPIPVYAVWSINSNRHNLNHYFVNYLI